VVHPHTGRDNSEAMVEAKDILLQRGTTPRVYRNMLVFLAAESRQLDGLKEAMRSSLAWAGIVKDTDRLNLTQRDSALAKAKVAEALETVKTRIKETWCYLLYPMQDGAQADVEWIASKVPAQDGLLSRASKKLASDEGLLPELGPARLDRELQKYIWNGKGHLSLRDLWEYLNRYIYLPRVKDRNVLIKAVRAAVGAMVPGPFAYAERWDEKSARYIGLVLQNAANAPVVIDSDSVIVKPEVAEKQALETAAAAAAPTEPVQTPTKAAAEQTGLKPTSAVVQPDRDPTRFMGTVMISADRPAHEMRQIVEAIIEQLTVLPGSEVTLKLEIDAEVPNGLDRSKVRTLLENASTLGFIDKKIS
jgi:uncharacterized protein